MLAFRKIATMRRKRSRTQYHSYYQGLTGVLVLILREFVWMCRATSQGLGAGTPPQWAEGREAVKGEPETKPKCALESRDASITYNYRGWLILESGQPRPSGLEELFPQLRCPRHRGCEEIGWRRPLRPEAGSESSAHPPPREGDWQFVIGVCNSHFSSKQSHQVIENKNERPTIGQNNPNFEHVVKRLQGSGNRPSRLIS